MSTIKQVIDTSSIEIRNAQTSTVIPPGDISITLAASTAAQVFGNFSLQRSSTTSFGATLINILVPYIVSSGTLTSVTISLTRIVHQDGVASVTTNIPLSAPTPAFRLVSGTESLISVPITTPTIDNQSNAFSVSYLITLTFTATTNVTLLLHGLELDYSLNIPQTVAPVVVSSGPTTVTPTTNYTLVILDTSSQALTNVTLATGVEGGVVDIQLLTKRGLPANVRTMPFGSVYLDTNNSVKHLIFTNGIYRVFDEFTDSFYTSTQQGAKLVGTGAVGTSFQGSSITFSANEGTFAVGGGGDNGGIGATWVFTRSGSVWSQQGAKLVGTGAIGASAQGSSTALSADGNTLAIGGEGDNTNVGATWVFTRTAGVWTQQGVKLVGTGAVGTSRQGSSISISADGNTLAIGGTGDNTDIGASWVFTRTGGVWTQQGAKLVGTGAVLTSMQGNSVYLSADGNTLAVGGPGDNTNVGATWVFTRAAAVWTQQGAKLVGTGAVGTSEQGFSVALSANGNTLAVGGTGDNTNVGATWVFTRAAAVWTQQGAKLLGTGAVGTSEQGFSISLSADGNTLSVGGQGDNTNVGAVWIFTRSGAVWFQQGVKLVGTGAIGAANQGFSSSLSAYGNVLAIGGQGDNTNIGASWLFV